MSTLKDTPYPASHATPSTATRRPADRRSPRKSIQAVEIGVRVLDALVEAKRSLALREVATASGMSRSQAHRYLLAFVSAGVVQQDAETGLYDLGAWSVRLGLAALGRMEAIVLATDALEALVRETGRTGLLTVWGDFGPTIIRLIQGARPVITSIGVGSALPLLTSSAGHAFLAYLPRSRTDEVLRRERRTGRAADGADLKEIVATVRARGFSAGSGTVVAGLSTISAPVLDLQGHAAAVIGLVARSDEKLASDAATVAALLQAAARASQGLGWSSEAH